MSASKMPSFDSLISEFYEPLYRFGYSLAKSEHGAADLVQQTFLIWAKKGADLRDPSKAKSWLFTTLYREFLRQRRKSAPITSLDQEWLEERRDPIPVDQVRRLEGKDATSALESLDDVYREPLTLFYLEDLSYKEIAEILDIPIGTVMSRLSRGKTQLKDILNEKFLK